MSRNTTNKIKSGVGSDLQKGNLSKSGRGHGRITSHDINNPKPNRAARRAMASAKIKRGDA
tara:strand:+ start:6855 stop:7037 length:183 start_codon:yes stop_codon:yes gene_type:complete